MVNSAIAIQPVITLRGALVPGRALPSLVIKLAASARANAHAKIASLLIRSGIVSSVDRSKVSQFPSAEKRIARGSTRAARRPQVPTTRKSARRAPTIPMAATEPSETTQRRLPPAALAKDAHVKSLDEYKAMYASPSTTREIFGRWLDQLY